jgi:hypothetical protein
MTEKLDGADQKFVKAYGEAHYLLAHAVSGDMPMGMRLTLLRHAAELADRATLLGEGPQRQLGESLVHAVKGQRERLNSEVTV